MFFLKGNIIDCDVRPIQKCFSLVKNYTVERALVQRPGNRGGQDYVKNVTPIKCYCKLGKKASKEELNAGKNRSNKVIKY